MEAWAGNCKKQGLDQGSDGSYWGHYGEPQRMEQTFQDSSLPSGKEAEEGEPTDRIGLWNLNGDQGSGHSKQWSRPPVANIANTFEVPIFSRILSYSLELQFVELNVSVFLFKQNDRLKQERERENLLYAMKVVIYPRERGGGSMLLKMIKVVVL